MLDDVGGPKIVSRLLIRERGTGGSEAHRGDNGSWGTPQRLEDSTLLILKMEEGPGAKECRWSLGPRKSNKQILLGQGWRNKAPCQPAEDSDLQRGKGKHAVFSQ